MANSKQIIDVEVQTTDKTGPGLNSAKKQLSSFDQAVQKTQQRLKGMMAAEYKTVLRAIDQVTPATGRIRSTLRALTRGSFTITIKAVDKTAALITNVRNKLGSLKAQAANIFSAATGFTGQMAAGAGIGYGIYDTVNTYKNFEAQMSSVGSVLGQGSGTEDMLALTQKARDMGAVTSFSATQAGQALQYMAMAGWKTEEMMDGIKPIMDLAAASGEDLAHTSDIVTDALTAFGLKAKDAGHFADVLAQASSNSNTNVAMMGLSFQYAAPLAGALKYSVEDVSLSLGLMANAGIKADKAGTALRSTFTRLIDPPKDAAASLEELRIDVKNADGSMKPWRQTLTELRTAFSGLSEAEKAQHASNIAGTYAMSGFLAMMNAEEKELKKLAGAIDNSTGATERMAKIKLDNLAGDLTILASTWESVQHSLMSGPGSNFLREFVQGAQKDLEKFNNYLKDGLDISDVGKIALDILVQLKDKFLELNGVGSLLAGGALAMSLYKIAKLTRGIGNLFQMPGGGGAGVPGGMAAASNMTVNAANVVVNGKGIAGGGGLPGGIGGAPGGAGAGGAAASAGWLAKANAVSRVALPLMALASAANIYGAITKSAQRAEEAEWAVQQAAANGDETDYANALDYQDKVKLENNKETYGAELGAAMGAAGSALGMALAGPLGGAIGGAIGQALGESKGREGAEMEAGLHDDNRREEIIAQIREDEELMLEETETNINEMQKAWDEASANAKEGSLRAGATVSDVFSNMGVTISSALSGIGDWLSGLGSSLFGSPTPHAAGGFAFSPHMGLVGEAGPEAIIPLGASRRERGLDLWEKTAAMLGVDDGADLATFTGGTGGNVSIELGGISPTFTISGGDPQEIMGAISANIETIADQIGGKIAEKVGQIYSNQPALV